MSVQWTQFTTGIAQSFSIPFDLTGLGPSNVAIEVTSVANPTAWHTLSGVASSLTTGVPSTFNYTFSSSDVAVSGSYLLVIVVTNNSGAPWRSYPLPFVIVSA
jgi:hypothetical protein